ncbi:MAG: hypothetical protein D6683_07515 [Actinomyces sp.]|nr:MAG: hypothetical protein D6683_07515 [Actinomyces sp.]
MTSDHRHPCEIRPESGRCRHRPDSRPRRRRRLGALAVALVLMGAACSVPTDEHAEVIDQDRLPESLRSDGTTTTTTTVPTPVTETVTVYLLRQLPDSDRQVVEPVTREVPFGADLATALMPLFGEGSVTEDETANGLVSSLFEFQLLDATVDTAGIATIDIVALTPEGEPITEPLQVPLKPVAAQLVWSATEHEGVEAVRLHINGEAVAIPTDRGDAEPDEPLRRDDFPLFDPDFVPATTTTTTAPASTTSSPGTTPDTTTTTP